MKFRFYLLAALGLFISSPSWAADALFAVANNFYGPMKALKKDFESVSPHHISISTGSTGQLYVQITQGAPFDLFFAADTVRPQKLVKAGQASGEFTYAKGTLILWSEHPGINVEKTLLASDFDHLAMANPKLAPYGLAAQQTLNKMGLNIRDKIVLGKGLNPTFQYVVTGNADLGFIAKSQVFHDNQYKKGSYWEIPHQYYSEIKQDAVILPAGKRNQAARDFLKYFQSARAQKIVHSYGYM
jgi:molybdate transport system substrate-binding protein